MSRIFRTTFFTLLGLLALYVGAVGAMLYGKLDRDYQTVSGTCPDYERFAEVMKEQGAPVHDGALSQIPKNVRDMRYFFFAHDGHLEMRFRFDEDQFIAWVETLGWRRDAILANHHGGNLVLYDSGPKDRYEAVDFDRGYFLESYGPRENATHGINDNFPVRTIGYDESSHTVYLKLWTPLPAKLKNELEARVTR